MFDRALAADAVMMRDDVGRATRRSLCLALLLLGAACSTPPPEKPTAKDEGDLLWPKPPELPRYAWETDLRRAADLFEDDSSSKLKRLLAGQSIPQERAFEKPAAVAAARGRIYVADTVQRRIVVFDVPRRKVFVMGLRAPGTLVKPMAVALDARQHVYVVDATLRKVMVYDGLGLFQRSIGSSEELTRPTGVAAEASGERIYVIDRADNQSERHRVLAYDGEGRLLREIGSRGHEPGQFNIPVQGAVAADGTLWVLDAGNFRVQAFDREGRFLRAFGRVGTGLGQFARPRSIACDRQGNIYISDAAFGNVQVFSPEGELLLALGRHGRLDKPGRYGLAHGVAVDETGRVYVVDQLFNKVEVLRRLSEDEGRALVEAARTP
jgi:DNA-binding beta-propeller fold protein YncE